MCLFFVLSFISLIVAVFMEKYKGVVGLVTLALLTTAILVYTKYVAVVFHYDLVVEDVDEPLFVVRQTVGKRNVTLSRIALANINSVEKQTRAERRARKTVGVSRYIYTPTLSPDESFCISISSRTEKAEIIVEMSDEFSEMLTSLVKEAKAMRESEEQDD